MLHTITVNEPRFGTVVNTHIRGARIKQLFTDTHTHTMITHAAVTRTTKASKLH
jgi:hypothetical protein